ncbi:MAG: hypothetical protein IPL67_08520 [Ignavibacteria bacterium]|nr:hypothetical protein [Ignavibacteria bacterium]
MKNGLTSTNNNKDILSSDKIDRKKFFLLAGIAALGTALVSVFPFGKRVVNSTKKEPIKISPNPHAVKRNNSQKNHG